MCNSRCIVVGILKVELLQEVGDVGMTPWYRDLLKNPIPWFMDSFRRGAKVDQQLDAPPPKEESLAQAPRVSLIAIPPHIVRLDLGVRKSGYP